MAAGLGLSLVHLVRLFRRDLRTTPNQYFEGRRIEHALKLLRLPDARPKRISYELGFRHLPISRRGSGKPLAHHRAST
jgi:AraC-like DNA-binding protein